MTRAEELLHHFGVEAVYDAIYDGDNRPDCEYGHAECGVGIGRIRRACADELLWLIDPTTAGLWRRIER